MLAVFLTALTAPTTGMIGRTRLRVLRPCSTMVVDFTDHRVLTVRATLLFAVVFAVITAVLLVVLVRMQVHPLLTAEVIAALGMLLAHVIKVIGDTAGKLGLAAG